MLLTGVQGGVSKFATTKGVRGVFGGSIEAYFTEEGVAMNDVNWHSLIGRESEPTNAIANRRASIL